MPAITVWSDLRCPWAYVSVLRLHRMRDRLGATEVDLDLRALPLELIADHIEPERSVRAEMVVTAQLEPNGFSHYENESWPSTFLPAWEAQKWGFSLGQDVGERFDLALRRAFFLHSHDLSRRDELIAIAEREGLAADQLADALDDGRYRKHVVADAQEARNAGVGASPTIELPDGTRHVNPGVSFRWVRGLPILEADHPSVYEDIIQAGATGD